jgi:hypothetical protein
MGKVLATIGFPRHEIGKVSKANGLPHHENG